ncbi:AraC family transcriptional regulator [Halomonas elongata]|uniref:helix-turn-helix transcriptional regulator n=1 Tax=Halomonas elongata TaxID=2746 RepID=UPI0038D4D57E
MLESASGEERSYPLECLSDTHGFHQLLVGLAGRVDVEVEGRGAAVVPGSVCVIPAGATHHYLGIEAANRCRVLDMAVGDDALDALFERIRFLKLPVAEVQGGNDQDLLARVAEAPLLAGPRFNLARLTRIVEADLAAPWSLATLAEAAHLSERQLRRGLSTLTGLTPWRWLQRRRLARATWRLASEDTPLTAIALDCGFHDAAHFSRLFREWRGMSPREYRRCHRG